MKRIVLCADDYGQAPAISQGIIALIQNERISATTCMVTAPHWAVHAKWLYSFKNKIDIGLHFNLTHGRALSGAYIKRYGEHFFSLTRLLSLALLHRLNKAAIEAECHAQIDRFVDAMGFLPDFLDGHQHIHQFPILRDAVINVFKKRLDRKKTYMRLVKSKLEWGDLIYNQKKIIIAVLGMQGLKKILRSQSIPHNTSFAGMYSFAQPTEYRKFFCHFLQQIEDRGLIMCHPALNTTENDDVISKARDVEYQYFVSQQFLADCQQQEVTLQRFSNFTL